MWFFGGLGVETEMIHPSTGTRWPKIWAAFLAAGGGALTPTGPFKATTFHFYQFGFSFVANCASYPNLKP